MLPNQSITIQESPVMQQVKLLLTLREAVNSLSEEEHKALFYAFDNGIAHTIDLPNGYFVTVYAKPEEEMIERRGHFALGKRGTIGANENDQTQEQN